MAEKSHAGEGHRTGNNEHTHRLDVSKDAEGSGGGVDWARSAESILVNILLGLLLAIAAPAWAQPSLHCRVSQSDPSGSIAACTRSIAIAQKQKQKCEQERVWAWSTRHPKRLPDSATATPDCPGGYVPVDGLRDGYVARAGNFLILRQYATAIADLQSASLLAPEDAGIHDALGQAYEEAAQFGPAINEYGKSIRLAPRVAAAWAARCRVRAKLGKQKQAQADCRHALSLQPENAKAAAVQNTLNVQALGSRNKD